MKEKSRGRFEFQSVLGPFMEWREFGGITLSSRKGSRHSFWRSDKVGNKENERIIQSGYRARNGMR